MTDRKIMNNIYSPNIIRQKTVDEHCCAHM